MKLIILPGFDGTGLGLRPLIDALAPGIDATVLSYPNDSAWGYEALRDWVRPHLPRAPYILLGESFSGPLALQLAADRPEGLRAVVLAASFARLDLPLKPLFALSARYAPPRAAPIALLRFLLTNGVVRPDLEPALKSAIRSTPPDVLRARTRAVLAVDLPAEAMRVKMPALYLQATRDRLIPAAALESVRQIAPQLEVIDVDAPHFLLQTRAHDCAAAIKDFVGTLPALTTP